MKGLREACRRGLPKGGCEGSSPWNPRRAPRLYNSVELGPKPTVKQGRFESTCSAQSRLACRVGVGAEA